MPAPRIVPAFDEVEDREPRLALCTEPLLVEQLALERREEALAQRVVVGIAMTGSPAEMVGDERVIEVYLGGGDTEKR